MKSLTFYCLILFVPLFCKGQLPTQTLYSTGEASTFLTLSTTFDQGIIASGFYTDSLGTNNALLVRYDSLGNLLWAKGYNFSNDDQALSVQQTQDSGFVLGGHAVNGLGGQDMFLAKTDANGNLSWVRQYGGSGTDWGRVAMEDPFGGYILGGGSNSFANSTDVLLIKTDLSGNLLWSSTYSGQFIEEIYTGIASSESGFSFAGHSFSATGSQEIFALSLDPFLNFNWATVIIDNGFGRARKLALRDSTLFMLSDYTPSGAANQDILVTQFDPTGRPAINRVFASPNFEQCRDFTAVGDSGWHITGLYREATGDNRPFSLKVDEAGQVASAYGYGSSESDVANTLAPLGTAGAMAIAGTSEGFRTGNTSDAAYLITTDSLGLSNCPDIPLTFTSDTLPVSYVLTPLIINSNPGTQTYLTTATEIDLSLTSLSVCTFTHREEFAFSEATVWPNPAHNRLFTDFQGTFQWKDALGRKINVPYTQGVPSVFMLDDLPPGVYFLTLKKGAQQETKRIILRP